MENEPNTTTDNMHSSVKPYKKWIEWTLILLLIAIIIGLIQIYVVSNSTDEQAQDVAAEPVPQDGTMTAEQMQQIREQISNREPEPEDTEVIVVEGEETIVSQIANRDPEDTEELDGESEDQVEDEVSADMSADIAAQIQNRPAEEEF